MNDSHFRHLNRRDERKALIQLRSGKGLAGATVDAGNTRYHDNDDDDNDNDDDDDHDDGDSLAYSADNDRAKEAMFPPLDIKVY